MEYTISTDKSKLNIDIIHDYLSNQSYWAPGRTRETIETTIKNSICFGVFDKLDNQVGFARVITDGVVFGYIMDVFILPAYQGKGLGKMLMEYILNSDSVCKVRTLALGTEDAHGLYSRFGFTSLDKPQKWMIRRKQ